MDDERLRVADVGEVRKNAQRLDEAAALVTRAADREAEHRAAASRQERLRQHMVGMLRQLGIPDRFDQITRVNIRRTGRQQSNPGPVFHQKNLTAIGMNNLAADFDPPEGCGLRIKQKQFARCF